MSSPMSGTAQLVSIRSRARDVPRVVYVVLGVALALRVAWVVYAAREPASFGDPLIYLGAARRMADGSGYLAWFSDAPTAFHPIGYPAWLAGIAWTAKLVGLDGHLPLLIGLVQALLGTASVALVYAITLRLFEHRVAVIAAALVACFPNLVFYTALVYSETLYAFCVLLAVWLVVRADWKPAPALPAVVAFGIVVGLSWMIRPFLVLSPLLLGAAVWRTRAGLRSAARLAAISGAVAVVMLVPWTLRNAFTFHAFVPVSTNLGDTLCLDNSPGAYGGFRELPAECSPVNDRRSEPTRNSQNLRFAVRWATHHPVDEAELLVRRAYYGYRDDHDSLTDLAGESGRFPPTWLRTPLSWLADVYYYVVLALALPAVVRFGRDPRRLFVLLVACSLAIVPFYLYGLPRFHIPLLPFLAIGAAVTLDAVRTRRERAQA
jgi:4-amino-4-deoxy-L-arabinose transferase-like glycosyltransferase